MSANNIVQYVVVREDLLKALKWPVGALIAQACHACTAAVHLNYHDNDTQRYLEDLDRMHKIILKAPGKDGLVQLSESLTAANILHKLWMEQPEDIPTCLAIKPYPRDQVQDYFKQFKLYR